MSQTGKRFRIKKSELLRGYPYVMLQSCYHSLVSYTAHAYGKYLKVYIRIWGFFFSFNIPDPVAESTVKLTKPD